MQLALREGLEEGVELAEAQSLIQDGDKKVVKYGYIDSIGKTVDMKGMRKWIKAMTRTVSSAPAAIQVVVYSITPRVGDIMPFLLRNEPPTAT
jgi:hypothetical protein